MGSSAQWPSIAKVENPIAEMCTRRPGFRFERYYPPQPATGGQGRGASWHPAAGAHVVITACWRHNGRDFRVSRPATAGQVSEVREELARECLAMIEFGGG